MDLLYESIPIIKLVHVRQIKMMVTFGMIVSENEKYIIMPTVYLYHIHYAMLRYATLR